MQLPSAGKFRRTDRDPRRLAEGAVRKGDERRGRVTPKEHGRTAPLPLHARQRLSNGRINPEPPQKKSQEPEGRSNVNETGI